MTNAKRKTVNLFDYMEPRDSDFPEKNTETAPAAPESFSPIRVEKAVKEDGRSYFRFSGLDSEVGVRQLTEKLEKTGGVPDWTFSLIHLQQTMNAGTKGDESSVVRRNAISAAMLNIGPKDGIEGMLAGQLVAVHNHIMECLRHAVSHSPGSEQAVSYQNQAAKLMRMFAAHTECLSRYRRNGVQKVLVEHVNHEKE